MAGIIISLCGFDRLRPAPFRLPQPYRIADARLAAKACGLSLFHRQRFLLAGVAVLAGIFARLAAALSALQMGLVIFLVWLPITLASRVSVFNWGELVVACVLTSAAGAAADSYRGPPWLSLGKLEPQRDVKVGA